MKLFSSKKRTAILGALVGVMTLGSVAFAANTPVKLDAFYDTFKLNVNGTQQFINDRQFKPFIADSRIYIPLSTLNQLGVVSAQWDASTASVNITPSGTAGADTAILQQQITALAQQVSEKNSEITKLKEENTKLGAEVDQLKKDNNSSSSTSDSRALRDLEDTLNRNRSFNRYSSRTNLGTINLDFRVDAYRNDVEVEMYIINKLTNDEIKTLRDDVRDFDRYIEDLSAEVRKTFKDTTVYITVYNGEVRDNPTKIGDYTYDGRRLNGRIN